MKTTLISNFLNNRHQLNQLRTARQLTLPQALLLKPRLMNQGTRQRFQLRLYILTPIMRFWEPWWQEELEPYSDQFKNQLFLRVIQSLVGKKKDLKS